MSVHDSDSMTETVEDLLRSGVLLGTRLAERRIRNREMQLRDAAHHSLQAAEQERERQLHQRSHALASLEGVHSDNWWDHASANDIRQAWVAAREYQAQEPRAARAVWRIADELQDRYGIDVRRLDPAALGEQPQLPAHTTLSAQELHDYDRRLRRQTAELQTERGTADPDHQLKLDQQLNDISELRELIARELGDREHPTNHEPDRRRDARELADARIIAGPGDDPAAAPYDSPERREQLAERLKHLGASDGTVEAVILADTGQAQPADMATGQASRSLQGDAGNPRPRRTLHNQRRRNRG